MTTHKSWDVVYVSICGVASEHIQRLDLEVTYMFTLTVYILM